MTPNIQIRGTYMPLIEYILYGILLAALIIFGYKTNSQINEMAEDIETIRQDYKYVVIENEAIYGFLENLDTYKDLDDALKGLDNLYDELQHLEE